MTNITELAQSLKAAAEKAQIEEGLTWFSEEQLSHEDGIALHKADAEFIAMANPANILALVEALEKAQQPVVPPMQHWEELCREHPDMSIGDAIIRAAWWNHCRAAMLQAGNSPVIPDGLIAAVNRLLDSDGSRGCYSAIRCRDARAEVERLLATAPQEVPDGK
ncbi:hypothetical protein [Klebsiella michiganensis]|uniref:hypothetical protein n=1 Tax=Klebsiella michiganensis TaxID=1134687 RepID=UPI002597D1B6|nr:hypothetical protein [Klebsiella michiganensis]MDM4568191.1 hypothetical protein [Klebsiella michiganensis]MDM4584687.1 hypothetical protein [Klebsiella michiganensis]